MHTKIIKHQGRIFLSNKIIPRNIAENKFLEIYAYMHTKISV